MPSSSFEKRRERLQSGVLMDTDEHGGAHLLLTFSNYVAGKEGKRHRPAGPDGIKS